MVINLLKMGGAAKDEQWAAQSKAKERMLKAQYVLDQLAHKVDLVELESQKVEQCTVNITQLLYDSLSDP